MTVGLVLSVVCAILIFFGLADTFFKRLGLPSWVGFLISLLLIAGALIPNVVIGNFTMNLGGFIVPLIGAAIIAFYIGMNFGLLRAIFAAVTFAAVEVAVRLLIMPETIGMIMAASLIVGFLGGAIAYIIGRTRLSTLMSVMFGVVLGDLIVNLIYVYGIGGYVFSMGTRGVFDALLIGCVFGIVMLEAIEKTRQVVSDGRTRNMAMQAESSDMAEFGDYFDDDNMM